MNEQDLMDLLQASALAGFNVPPNADLQLQVLESDLKHISLHDYCLITVQFIYLN